MGGTTVRLVCVIHSVAAKPTYRRIILTGQQRSEIDIARTGAKRIANKSLQVCEVFVQLRVIAAGGGMYPTIKGSIRLRFPRRAGHL